MLNGMFNAHRLVKSVGWLLLSLISVAGVSLRCEGSENIDISPTVELTAQEQAYLMDKKVLRVNSGTDIPPIRFIANDQEQGFSIDLVRYMASLLATPLVFERAPWSTHMQNLQRGDLDMLIDITNTPERRKSIRFTQPYLQYHFALVVRNTESAVEMSLDDLVGKKVAAVTSWATTVHIEQHYPKINLIYVDSSVEALRLVAEGKVEAHIVGDIWANYLIKKYLIANVHLIPLTETILGTSEAHAIGVRLDNTVLRSILDKALLAIPEQKWIELRNKWFGQFDFIAPSLVSLTLGQKKWLLAHDQLKLHLPQFGLPLGQRIQSSYQGSVADFIGIIEGALGTQWMPPQGVDFPLMTADMTVGDPKDPSLQSQFIFSQPLMTMPVVVLTGDRTMQYVDELSKLNGFKVGALSNANYLNEIRGSYPQLKLQTFASVTAAVLAVNSGDIDFLLCPLAHCTYQMDELGANNTRIIGQTGYVQDISIGIRKDWPQLLEIVDATLLILSPQRKNAIYRRWNSRSDVVVKIDYSRFWSLLVIALVIIGAVVIRNRNISVYVKTIERTNQALKKSQSQLLHADKMASLGTLTAGVAHEINNPTNFVYVGAQNLAVDLKLVEQFIFDLAGEDADDEILSSVREKFALLHDHIDTIKNGAERIKEIVQDLRAFSRLDSTSKVLADVTDCLLSTLHLVRTKYLELVQFETQFKPIPQLLCHPPQLNQVFMNLIVNASDAIRDKRRLAADHKKLGKIIVGCTQIDHDVVVTIEDDGCGMSDEVKAKIFEPFYTTKKIGEGTGLGLAISVGIIEEHGGTIEVASTVGVGSRITVRLPLTDQMVN